MTPPTPEEFWTARSEAIDSEVSRIIHTVTAWAAQADPWDIQELAVRLVDQQDVLREVGGRIVASAA